MYEHSYKQDNSQYQTRRCEICGKVGILEYMYAMGASWHVTGHFMIPSFNCQTEPSAQHWGCSPEHAMAALVICLQHDQHMSINVMKGKHVEADKQGLPRHAPEHERLKLILPNFPFVK